MCIKSKDILERVEYKLISQKIVDIVLSFSRRGWTPATSSNFSAKIPDSSGLIAITKSGIDKEQININDITIVNRLGNVISTNKDVPSAETLIHTTLYEDLDIKAVMHTHSVNSTILSISYSDYKVIEFSNLEILKGLYGNVTHDLTERLPIFSNTQDMEILSCDIRNYMAKSSSVHGLLIEGHGLYSWGRCLDDAKRHIEVFEFLFEYLLKGEK